MENFSEQEFLQKYTFFQFEEVKNQFNKFSVFIQKNTEKPIFDYLLSFIDNMPDEKLSIEFFDYFHPKWSDDGAYITVSKYCSKIYYKKGNHGWSSDWYLSNSKRIVAYILKNWEHNQHGFTLTNYKYLNVINPQTIENIWNTQLTHIQDNIFELNGEFIIENEKIKYHTDIFDFENIKKNLDFSKLDKINII